MQCDDFRVYWNNGVCYLDEISLEAQGLCQSCIFVTIGKEILEKKRQEN